MNTLLILLFNLLFITNGFSCTEKTAKNDNDNLPDTRPEKLSIQYSLGGGMAYYSENLYISQDSCVYTINDEGAISKYYFTMTGEQLDNLYKVFKDNNFNKIKTREEMIYDRGGESIGLSWGKGKYAHIDDAGMTLIEDSWKKEWSECLGAVKNVLSEQLNKQKKDYEVRIDKTLFGKTMKVYVKEEIIIPESTVMAENELENHIAKTARLLPGKNIISVSCNQKYLNITANPDSTKGVNLYLKNDTLLTYSFIK
jgi:hypothetical protein